MSKLLKVRMDNFLSTLCPSVYNRIDLDSSNINTKICKLNNKAWFMTANTFKNTYIELNNKYNIVYGKQQEK